MFTYQIQVEYLGTNFAGWQIQKNAVSVQETLEKIFSSFLDDKIRIIGSGRTDAGVHAIGQSAHFKSAYKILNKNNFLNSINYFLRKYNISILNIKNRPSKFHARHIHSSFWHCGFYKSFNFVCTYWQVSGSL